MLSRGLQRIPLSKQNSLWIQRSIHSGRSCLDQPKDDCIKNTSDPNQKLNQQRSTSSPPSGAFRYPAAPQSYSPRDRQPYPNYHPPNQFAKPPSQNPSYPPGNPYHNNQPFPQHSHYGAPHQLDPRTPPHLIYHSQPQAVPWSNGGAPQHASNFSQPQGGFNNLNGVSRFQPSPPPHMSYPSGPHGMFPHASSAPIPQPSMNSQPQPSVQRSKKTPQSVGNLDFDFQDLEGANALDQFADASPKPSNNNNQPPFPQRPVDPRMGNMGANFSRGGAAAYSQSWNNANYPGFNNTSANHKTRNSEQNKNRMGGRVQSNNNNNNKGNTRRPTGGPNQFRRDKGRGLLSAKPEPKLPPPPKTVLDERGEYGAELTPSGVPESTPDPVSEKQKKQKKSKTEEELILDYQAIPRLMTESTVPVNLPGFMTPIQFKTSPPSETDNHINWAHGHANKTQILNRAFHLVLKNPSLLLNDKKQTLALVDFLLLSKDERLAKIKS